MGKAAWQNGAPGPTAEMELEIGQGAQSPEAAASRMYRSGEAIEGLRLEGGDMIRFSF